MTNILLTNIPSGANPTDFPPIGISNVIEGVDPCLNCNIFFLDLDYYRPSFEKIEEKIRGFSPQILGFSAILTPAYSYLKELSAFIKNRFPDVIQVMGGEMAVISNIILQKTKIDFCVTGESEPAFSDLIAKLQQDKFMIKNRETYKNIKGLAYLLNGIPYFTGYAEILPDKIKQINYELISKFTNLGHYMQRIDGQQYKNRINKHEIKKFFNLFHTNNPGKKIANVQASKGCVGKCTFCHRFFKGYRTLEPDTVISYIDDLTKKYDIGLIQFAEENFGSNIKRTLEITNYLKEKKINWAAGAVRANTVNEEMVKRWKESGCVHINFGVESCSQKMLDVMEKYTAVEENLNALKLLYKYGILTIVGLVLGMPGESEQTIEETIHNLSKVLPDDINAPYEICINWFQAVPGTPAYEYARSVKKIGLSLEEEENYIQGLYNVDANNIKHYLNFTDYEKEEIAYWKDYIFLELIVACIKKHGVFNILKYKKANRYKYGLIYMLFPKIIRKFLLKYLTIVKCFGIKRVFYILYKKIFLKKPVHYGNVNCSLRKLNRKIKLPIRKDDIYTHALRQGR
ncbi:MAG: B12-binding domain-containing radical SAM protein [Elusimicrobia bacterium]|nr:B12-binding domain-containing radical SAM protein [Elusimicrobiota bacterium]